jgi:hypothetical protein
MHCHAHLLVPAARKVPAGQPDIAVTAPRASGTTREVLSRLAGPGRDARCMRGRSTTCKQDDAVLTIRVCSYSVVLLQAQLQG